MPSQVAFIIKMARAFKLTHLVECGRMGGLPLVHYEHFGFNVTSFELSPQRDIKETLTELAPSVKQIDGDCIVGIPSHIDAIIRAELGADHARTDSCALHITHWRAGAAVYRRSRWCAVPRRARVRAHC